MTSFMNHPLMRKYCAGLSVGSKMKEIKSSQFSSIPFPKFPSQLINTIANLYSNKSQDLTKNVLDMDSFLEVDLEWMKGAGIIQLDNAAKRIQNHLEETVHNIIKDQPVKASFDFLNRL